MMSRLMSGCLASSPSPVERIRIGPVFGPLFLEGGINAASATFGSKFTLKERAYNAGGLACGGLSKLEI